MATATQTTETGLVPYRLTVAQFTKIIDTGIFPECAHIELIEGMLVDKMTKNTPHNFAVTEISALLRQLLPGDWFVLEEKAVVLGLRDRPEPDAAVVRGPRANYRTRDPRPSDIVLLIEVADSSYPKDRNDKWSLYAAARVANYWIVNIPQARIEVYTQPSGRGKAATYHNAISYGLDAEVPVVIEGREHGKIKVRDLLA